MGSTQSTFSDWTQGRQIRCIGTNAYAPILPFQHWQHFKEAFVPELIQRAIEESQIPVVTCLDPFGGSGTTALACQFLGVRPTTVEINPYLADLIEAKLTIYSADHLARDFGRVLRKRASSNGIARRLSVLPKTFVEPGHNDRWLFEEEVAEEICQLLDGIESLDSADHRRLLRILLGGTLLSMSNVRMSGKGRRYRSNWKTRRLTSTDARFLFVDAVQQAITEIHQFSRRPVRSYEVIRGDSRHALAFMKQKDLVVFSPPYPNSFDYTDVYNIELWMLGYLKVASENRDLRNATLSSHVQIKRNFSSPPSGSKLLSNTMQVLERNRDQLWSPHIPAMIGSYFQELDGILSQLRGSLSIGGAIWMVVGDSQYGGHRIETAGILQELAPKLGFEVRQVEPFRSMRASPQQGGKAELPETLIVLGARG